MVDTKENPVQEGDQVILNEKLGLELAISDMQESLRNQSLSISAFKATTRHLLSAASLIVALIGALQLYKVQISDDWIWLYTGVLFLIAGLYIALVMLCVWAQAPIVVMGPIREEWELFREFYMGKSEIDILRVRLSGYLHAFDLNKEPIAFRVKLTKAASVILPVIVVILLLLSLVPRTLLGSG